MLGLNIRYRTFERFRGGVWKYVENQTRYVATSTQNAFAIADK